MKYVETYFKVFIATVVMLLGTSMGAYINADAQDPSNTCGVCDHTTYEKVEGGFCNFTFYGDCGGNDGGPCGGVPCGG